MFCFVWEDPLSKSDVGGKGAGFGPRLVSLLIERKWNGVVTVDHSSHYKSTLEVPIPKLFSSFLQLVNDD